MNKLIATLTVLAALTCNAASAANAFNFHSLGFSADGRYFAFIESVMGDGSGYPIARGQIIDVVRNQLVKSADVFLQNDTATEAQAVKKAAADLGVANYGIDGKTKGRTLWTRLATDLSAPLQKAEFSTEYNVNGGASSVWPRFELTLTELAAPSLPEECSDLGSGAKMMKLELMSNFDGQASSKVLQQDTHLPKSRNCSSAYQIRQVIENQGQIVVVLRFNGLGFEGPDYNHMVVTGALK